MPYIFGVILNHIKDGNTYDYSWDMCFLIGGSMIATLISCMIFYFNRVMGNPLNEMKPPKNIKQDKVEN